MEEVLRQHDAKLWTALTETQNKLAREAANDFVVRVQREDWFEAFEPSDRRVRVFETQPATQPLDRLIDRNRPVHLSAPGFSDDHQFAVVRLSLPWSIHHADGTYLLARENGKWKVVLRQFIYYV